MITNYRRYRDDIRKTFISHALIPVIIITLASYVLSFSSLYRTIVSRNYTTNSQVAETLDFIIGYYQKQAARLSTDERVQSYLELKQATSEIYEVFYDLVNKMDVKANFYMFDNKLQPLVLSSNHIPEYAQGGSELKWGFVSRMLEMPDKVILARPTTMTGVQTLVVGKAIVKKDGYVAGFITFDFNEKDLVKLISKNFSTNVVITDQYGYVIASANELLVDQLGKLDMIFRDKSGVIKSKEDSHYVTRTENFDGEIIIYTLTSIGYFSSLLILAGVLLILLFAVLTWTTYLSARKIADRKTRVIDDIVRAIENVQTGNLDTRLNVNSNDEFQVFAEAYNQMLTDIKNLIEVNKEKARQNVLSEIKQLESQFNPHFLFNTLEMIRYMVKMDPPSVNKIIVGLSELLRYSINNTITEVSLGEDVEYTKNYLFIQKYRFGEKFNFNFDIDEETLACIVPKLIVQPIIENAIKYGFANRQTLSIQIEAAIDKENLVVIITDDGEGMEPEVLEKMRDILERNKNNTSHVGLFNVHRRVQLMYGEKYGIDISSRQHGGTVVKITLPINRGEGEHVEGVSR
ncbi:sensor histidine kinase [Paenibacillus aceris]|uniref:histidine kinase n=1 Tax=Paenibacillus aceris TaxID=869555 RepID=A0ABS4I6Z2_9BACL|nr:sensor histidine kinase [Paenibacillus aceris]MBP1966186.1 sensor histidine kinase YesM [Paenibacillus aceris]NHW33341.1 sensor histidine kinase [Paenibacillus aceris]